MIAITNYATKSFAYALAAQVPRVVAALRHAGSPKAIFILAGDGSEEVTRGFEAYESALKKMEIECVRITMDLGDDEANSLRLDDKFRIARMQAAAWSEARLQGATLCWSLEADVLPPANALSVMMQTLAFDGGYYEIAMVTYPNESFLGGRGTQEHWILPSFFRDELEIPEELLAALKAKDAAEKKLREAKKTPTPKVIAEWQKLEAKVQACPPKGNVWQLNASHGWRQRGWLEHAYPALGRGAIVPSDWVGVGCTLLSARALSLAHFEAYDGGCTQDLYLCWKCWRPAGIRMAAITHVLAHHVKPKRDANNAKVPGEYELLEAYHEPAGECEGHLRMIKRPWRPELAGTSSSAPPNKIDNAAGG